MGGWKGVVNLALKKERVTTRGKDKVEIGSLIGKVIGMVADAPVHA